MGLFSSKKKTIVGLTTVPLIPEQSMFNESVIGAIFSNTNIAQSLAAELRNGWIGKANYYYRQTKNKLIPEAGRAVYSSFTGSSADTEQILSDILGYPITLLDSLYAEFDVTYSAYDHFIKAGYVFDPANDTVIGFLPENELAYFVSCRVLNGNLEIYYRNSAHAEFTEIVEDYVYESGTYFHALYEITSNGKLGVFFYDVITKQYPQLTQTQETATYNDYFPSIIIKKDKVDTYDSGTDYEKQANKILRRMGVNLEFVTEQFNQNEEGQSDVVDDVFITFALNIQDKYPGSIKYLFEYFYRIALDAVGTKEKFEEWERRPSGYSADNYIKYVDDQFNTFLGFNYITLETKSGSISDKYERETEIRDPGLKYIGLNFSIPYEKSSFILRKRIDDNTYEEIVINGMYHATDVVDGISAIRTLKDSISEPTEEDPSDRGFYIPLSKTIVDRLSMIEKKQVLYAAFVAPVYTIQIVKIKWYQTAFFRAVMLIVAIIITIYTTDFSGTALQIAYGIATNVIAGIIINEALKLVVDLIGIENAMILAIIATVVAVYNGGYNSEGLLWAQQLLQLSVLSFNAIGSEIKDEFVKLQNEISNFLQDAKELKEEIEEAEALLNNSKYNFYDVAKGRMYFNPYETPDHFYQRTVVNQNPGVQSFDLLYNYFDRMLQLPEHKFS